MCAALALVTLALFWPVRQFKFINFDDYEYVAENSHIEDGVTWPMVAWAFKSAYAGNWHPLTWLSHALDVHLFGLDAGCHHFTNLLFHVANSVLLFLVLKKTTRALWQSAFVAALFAIHPLHVESVAWVAERKDVLSTFFFLLTIWAYARRPEVRSQKSEVRSTASDFRPLTSGFYWLALLFFALGLMSKPMLVTTPFVLLLLDYWPLRRFDLKTPSGNQEGRKLSWIPGLLIEKIPFFILALASSVITFVAQGKEGAMTGTHGLPLALRIENAVVSYFRYIQKMFWPTDLAIFYPHPESQHEISEQLPLEIVICIGILLAVILAAGILAGRKRPYLPVGLFWFLGTLVPVIGIIQVGGQAWADRYSYIPLTGLFIVLAWGAADILNRLKAGKIILPFLAAAALVACAVVTRIQLGHWKDSITVFTRALACTKWNATAHFNLGAALEEKGNFDEAMKHYMITLQIDPAYANAQYNIGHALAAQGKSAEAIEAYKKVFSLNPNHLFARNNLGNVYLSLGRRDEAVQEYRQALKINPGYAPAHFNLGKVLADEGKYEEAIPHYNEALRLRPRYVEALTGLGLALAIQGNVQQALPPLREVVRLRPNNVEARLNLGNVLTDAGKADEARREFEIALKLQPDLVEKEKGMAQKFQREGNVEAAMARYLAATRLNPGDAESHQQLGSLFAQAGTFAEAQGHFAEVAKLRPDNSQAHYNLALSLTVQGRSEEAVSVYRRAIACDPDNAAALNDVAWILATHPKAEVRNGSDAVKFAQRACELAKNREARFLGTLDAALAETGQFEKAIETAEQARALATSGGQADLAKAAAERIELYQKKQPFRQK